MTEALPAPKACLFHLAGQEFLLRVNKICPHITPIYVGNSEAQKS